MKLWQNILEIFRRPATAGEKRADKEAFLKKYQSFREILSDNAAVLEIMADIEEKVSGALPVNDYVLKQDITIIIGKVKNIIDKLNLISHGGYPGLYEKFNEIRSAIEQTLTKREEIPAGGFVAPSDAQEAARAVPAHIEGYPVLIGKGTIASRGIGFGKAYVVRTGEDIKDFPEGAVLVARNASSKFAAIMDRTNAIITDVGSVTVHMATLAREFRIPAIVNTETGTEIIQNGQEVTVDAINGIVYGGFVKELSGFFSKKTRMFRNSGKALDLIIPLTLVDPDDERFKPGFCSTFHDIARFAHQKAMQEMFRISEELPEGVEALRLTAGIPLLIYIIDLGNGIEGFSEKLGPGHIRSIPFGAFLKGLASIEWPEPRHVDVRGFMGMIAHTASIPEEELKQMGEQSFAFISREYMNFSIRLGYHLSVVEAYAGENINDNYIRFFFKGGGADRERRLRRVSLIARILKKMDFRIKVTEDVADALVTKYRKSQIAEKMEILGRLTVYTKQMDAIMHDEATTEFYLKEFTEKHFRFER